MRLALTYALRLRDEPAEAEHDEPATIDAIVAGLRRLGHTVDPIEVSGPVARVVARLEASSPDLVVNLAAGRRGRFREAFFPALLAELGIPFTGSDAYTCAVGLDKGLTKLKLERAGVRTPRAVFVDRPRASFGLRLPVIVKPNFEGSSIGIGADAIVTREADLAPRVERALAAFPEGILVEEFVEGTDVVVAFLERDPKKERRRAFLPPGEYLYPGARTSKPIYDFERRERRVGVELRAPAALDPEVLARTIEASEQVVRALGVRDLALLDFRVTSAGEVEFLEIDPLPSLAKGPSYLGLGEAAGEGLDAVLAAIVSSAAQRHRIDVREARRRPRLRVGLAFNLKRVKPGFGGADDDEAEYDSPATIQAIHDAIASHGHDVVDLEATPELAGTIGSMGLDLVFNVAEGLRGRNREAQVPAILELLGIEYTGSDPATLALALDKGLAKRIVRQAGVATADWIPMHSPKEKLPAHFAYPLIVKPIAEGSSKGVLGSAVARSEAELREKVAAIVARYRQPALVEVFLPGREFTVALLGEKRPKVLPPMEIVFTKPGVDHPVYEFDHKLAATDEIRYEAPAKVDPALQRAIEGVARASFVALGCRDVARIDVRLDAQGRPNFIECNPLPGLTPEWSDLCLIGKGVGLEYRTLIGEIMAPALRRLKARREDRP
jgi:D-alanine-D-alanine ligase